MTTTKPFWGAIRNGEDKESKSKSSGGMKKKGTLGGLFLTEVGVHTTREEFKKPGACCPGLGRRKRLVILLGEKGHFDGKATPARFSKPRGRKKGNYRTFERYCGRAASKFRGKTR